MNAVPITLAPGDGFGPEITQAVLRVLEAGGAEISPEIVEIGEAAYSKTCLDGISAQAWESIERTGVLLKGPTQIREGRGYLASTQALEIRLGLYASLQPCISYAPYIPSQFKKMDVIVIRENEEELYGDLEYRQTKNVCQGLKLISLPGTYQILRYAFDLARSCSRKKVTVLSKDKVMEFTDGYFHSLLEELAASYPELKYEHQSLDVGTALLTDHPENFDVIVIPSLYGDILSALITKVSFSKPGMSAYAALGKKHMLFEAAHDPAPALAGQNLANPSGMLLAAIYLLIHIHQHEAAERIHNAWLATLEAGIHTPDIFREEQSLHQVGTLEFANAIIPHLGMRPRHFQAVNYQQSDSDAFFAFKPKPPQTEIGERTLMGVDIFLDYPAHNPEKLAHKLKNLNAGVLDLELISNLGVLVWPEFIPETRISDHWHCRFMHQEPGLSISERDILDLLTELQAQGFDFIKTENLYAFGGNPAFSA